MKIAICDDCSKERLALVNILHSLRSDWHISQFESGEDFLEALSNEQSFDLIFLDIFMVDLNGIDTAKEMRRMGFETAVVFFTTSRDFAVESYDVEALSYIMKPISEAQILAVINKFETRYRPKQIRFGNNLFAVDKILYIESRDKKVVVALNDGTDYAWTAKLDDVEEQLLCKQFLRCHRSFIVNMDVISRVLGGKFLLSNDVEIPIRRQEVAEITQKYYNYIVD